jgi:glycosyltransferase involved in cell wall biosynthesis
LANALEELSADPELCRKMGKNGRELGEREFDRRKLAGRLERVLVQVVKRS